MKRSRIKNWCMGLGLAGLTLGCVMARHGEPRQEAKQAAAPMVERGGEVFLQHCDECHPGGEAGEGPALKRKKFLPAFLIKTQVRLGLGEMPRFSKDEISPADLRAVAAYLKDLRRNK